jgi:hypothetical protein
VGLEVSKRQYNRRFRALQRLAAKAQRLDREWAKRRLGLVARAGFAGSVTLDWFVADPDAACFVAHYTARRKVRREFTCLVGTTRTTRSPTRCFSGVWPTRQRTGG